MAGRFNHVFIVTYGRSGSTLLQGLLNAIPGYRIYGENDGFLFKLQTAYEALLEANRNLPNPENDHERQAWFGSSRYTPKAVAAAFRRFVDVSLFQEPTDSQPRVLGFKEIRFIGLTPERLESYIAFVRELYPNAAFVFNTRDVEDVRKSGWWRNNAWDGLAAQLQAFGEFAHAFSAEHPAYAVHIEYDKLIQKDRVEVARLLAFLAEALTSEEIEAVFRDSHSYENKFLTAYLSGRAPHVELLRPDWWRSHVDEFQVQARRSAGGFMLTGAILPAVDSGARVYLDLGERRIELQGGGETPRIAALFAANPVALSAGFTIELPACERVALVASLRDGPEILVGAIFPGRGVPPRPPPKAPA